MQKGRRVAVAVPLCGVTLESWADLSVLARSRVLPRLRRLGGGFHDAAVRTVLRLPNLPPLTHLDLHTGQVGINGAAAIAACLRLAGLTELNLADNQIGDPGLTAIARSPHLRSLRVLNVAENPGVRAYSVAALAASPVAAGLEELYLGPCGGSNGAAALAGSGRFTRLGALDLDDDALRADGVRAIAESANFAGLTGLRLRGVFGSAGAEAIAASPHLTGLRDLFLVGCGIGDAGAAALADSPNAARLRTLNLGLNNLTDAAALALAKSPHLDGLRAGWLHLGGNRGITPAGVDALRDRFGYDPTSGAGPGGPPFTPESVRF